MPEGFSPSVKSGQSVRAKEVLASNKEDQVIRAPIGGSLEISGQSMVITGRQHAVAAYPVPPQLSSRVSDGDEVTAGTLLTDGHLDLQKALPVLDQQQLARYIIDEVQTVYAAQGQAIADKHVETIIRQMFSKVRVTQPGDSRYLVGEVVNFGKLARENTELKTAKKQPAQFEFLLLGVTKVATQAESFLAAASFQETNQILIRAASRGAVDTLRGLKENVIIGKLIPAGTGYPGRVKLPGEPTVQ